jgi:hypothetical protein
MRASATLGPLWEPEQTLVSPAAGAAFAREDIGMNKKDSPTVHLASSLRDLLLETLIRVHGPEGRADLFIPVLRSSPHRKQHRKINAYGGGTSVG